MVAMTSDAFALLGWLQTIQGRRQPSKCVGRPIGYVILSYDIIRMTSYVVVTALVKLFIKIMSLKTRLNDLIGNI